MARRKSTVLLEHYLKQLKLPTILREYESAAAVCSKENLSFQTFLLKLCERELLERQRRNDSHLQIVSRPGLPWFTTIQNIIEIVRHGLVGELKRPLSRCGVERLGFRITFLRVRSRYWHETDNRGCCCDVQKSIDHYSSP